MDRVIPESELTGEVSVPEGCDLYYVKLVGIGPNALSAKGGVAADVVGSVQGYYFIAPTDEIEDRLVQIVRRCFANRRSQKQE